MTVETDTNSVLNTFKAAFAPVTDALKNIQNVEVPEAARDFVKRTTGTAKERAADLHAGSEKVTAAIEAGRLLEHGSPPEVELRACAVHAVELLAAATGGRLSPPQIDSALWNRGREQRYKSVPRPRSRNTAY